MQFIIHASLNPFNKLPIIIENEVQIESKTLVEDFDLPMNFIIEFEFRLSESNNIDNDQILVQGEERLTDCIASIYFKKFLKKSRKSMLLKWKMEYRFIN